MKEKIATFIKKEKVMTVSLAAAVISVIFVHPDVEYFGYIDYRTLSILWCLMCIMAGLRDIGVFNKAARLLLWKTESMRGIFFILVFACFLSSMFITNDVSLITFVPFSIEVLMLASLEKYLIPVIVMQTIAANLGSMLTPMGNPQNLYLYSAGNMNFSDFILLMLPYWLISAAAIAIVTFLLSGKRKIDVYFGKVEPLTGRSRRLTLTYVLLFAVSILCVVRILPFPIMLAIVFVVIAVEDGKTLKKTDYALILTFVFLFIFIGNIKRIPEISTFIDSAVSGHELLCGILVSQVISNVPAAVLLSGFTENISLLAIAVNVGGLGTIIASMASLISFKFYSNTKIANGGRFMTFFTLLNILFIAVLCAASAVLQTV